MSFHIGDRVRKISSEGDFVPTGELGTVISLWSPDSFWNPDAVGVRWDRRHPYLHTCGGLCEDGHGSCVHCDNIELFDDMEEQDYEIDETVFDSLLGS